MMLKCAIMILKCAVMILKCAVMMLTCVCVCVCVFSIVSTGASNRAKRELTEQLTEQLSESIMTQARASMEVELRGQICEQTSDVISMHVQETQEGLEKVRCDSLRLIASEGIGLT